MSLSSHALFIFPVYTRTLVIILNIFVHLEKIFFIFNFDFNLIIFGGNTHCIFFSFTFVDILKESWRDRDTLNLQTFFVKMTGIVIFFIFGWRKYCWYLSKNIWNIYIYFTFWPSNPAKRNLSYKKLANTKHLQIIIDVFKDLKLLAPRNSWISSHITWNVEILTNVVHLYDVVFPSVCEYCSLMSP